MKNFFSFLLILFPFFFVGCEFSSSEIYEVQVDPQPDSAIVNGTSIDLLNEGDTIDLALRTTFSFFVRVHSNVEKHKTLLLFNGRELESFEKLKGEFTLNPTPYSPGNYELEVRVVTNSGTGSLGDKAGAEVLVFSRKWVVRIDNGEPEPVEITRFERSNGRLKVSWEEYKAPNFKHYVLIRKIRESFGTDSDEFYVKDQHQNWVYDSTYVGGKASYSLIVVTQKDKKATSQEQVYHDSLSFFYGAEIVEDKKIKLSWSKSKYPANFRGYRLTIGDAYTGSTSKEIFTSEQVNDTSFTIENPTFGAERILQLQTRNSYSSTTSNFNSSYTNFHFNEKFPAFHQFSPVGRKNSIYLAKGSHLYLYNEQTKRITNESAFDGINFQLRFAVDQHAKFLFAALEYSLQQLDPRTLAKKEIIATERIFGERLLPEALAVSAKGLLAVSAQLSEYRYVVGIYDLDKKKQIAYLPQNIKIHSLQFSEDGRSLHSSADTLYTFEQNELVAKNPIPDNYSTFIFKPGDSEKFYTLDNQYRKTIVRVRNTADLSLAAEYEIQLGDPANANQLSLYEVDPLTGYFGGRNGSSYLIYDLENEKVVREISIDSNEIHLFHNNLFSQRGVRLNLY